jgi:GNAT superfamily N-acetyltransferase
MKSEDGQTLSELYTASPDTGQIQIGPRYHLDAYTAFTAARSEVVGVVAEAPGRDELVGAGFVHFGRCIVEGELRDYASLSGVVVRPSYRRQGIASQIAKWRVECAIRRIGDEGVLLATIQKGNESSIAVAKKWSRQFAGETRAGVVRVRSEPPRPNNGITVQSVSSNQLTTVAHWLNNFYRDYNFYTPRTEESLANWLARSPFGTPVNHYYVAMDAAGEILAGAAVTEQYRIVEMQVHHMPVTMRWLNKVVKLVPPDGTLKQLSLNKIWFRTGELKAAQFLWETIRWEWREKANTLTVYFDPRSPVASVFKIPAWMPKGQLVMAIRGPVPISEDALVYPL